MSIFVDLGVCVYTIKMASNANVIRKYNAGYKVKATSKQKEKTIRGMKKKKSNNINRKEGVTYESGGFSSVKLTAFLAL